MNREADRFHDLAADVLTNFEARDDAVSEESDSEFGWELVLSPGTDWRELYRELSRQESSRTTEDLDIVVAPDQENLNRVVEWLMSIDAVLKLNPRRRFGAQERRGMHQGSNAPVLTPLGQIDVVQRIPGMPEWEDLVRQAEVYE